MRNEYAGVFKKLPRIESATCQRPNRLPRGSSAPPAAFSSACPPLVAQQSVSSAAAHAVQLQQCFLHPGFFFLPRELMGRGGCRRRHR